MAAQPGSRGGDSCRSRLEQRSGGYVLTMRGLGEVGVDDESI
jgi:hypothetical protein